MARRTHQRVDSMGMVPCHGIILRLSPELLKYIQLKCKDLAAQNGHPNRPFSHGEVIRAIITRMYEHEVIMGRYAHPED